MRYPVLLVVAALIAIPAAAFAQEEYKLQLDYKPRVGDIIEVTSQFEQTYKGAGVAVNRTVSDRANRSGTLTIRVSILEVDKKGRASRVTFKIEKYKGTGAGSAVAKFNMSKPIDVFLQEGKRWYTIPSEVKGESYMVDESWQGILELAVPLKLFNEPNYDDLFGTADAQKKGGAWKVAPERLASFYAHYGVPKEKVKSSAVLKDVRSKKDPVLLIVEGKLEMSGLQYKLPDGFKLTDDKYELTLSTLVPAEGGLPVEQSLRRFSSVSAAGPKGKASESTLSTSKATYKLVK